MAKASARRRLDKVLVDRGLAASREAARELITGRRVKVSCLLLTKPASMVDPEASIDVISSDHDGHWVSRGAYKLLKGLEEWGVVPDGLRCIDIGASTGGFTQVLLSRGAARVAAVDVGYGQLAWSLRNDERVLVMERTNARYLTRDEIGWSADLLTVDVSFISLRLLLPALEGLLTKNGRIIALVKPQFEVGRGKVGKGVVRDPGLHLDVLCGLDAFISDRLALALTGATFSPIRGPEGNIEFLFMLSEKRSSRKEPIDFPALVMKAHENFNDTGVD